MRRRAVDVLTNTINNTIRVQYAYIYAGKLADLRAEDGKAVGFEAWPFEKILNLSEEDKEKFIPLYRLPDFLEMFKEMLKLVNK